MDIEFSGEYDRKEFFRAVALANLPSRRGKIVRFALLGVIGIILVALVADSLAHGGERPDKGIRILVNVLILVYFLLSPYISSRRIASSLWKGSIEHAPLVEGRVNGQGITYVSKSSEKAFAWESFSRARKARDLVVLVTAEGTMSIHPRRFFRSDQDWARFQQLVDYYVVEPK